jgi:hypothetical protein
MPEPQTEQEWADFYQAHKDDPEIWGEPVASPIRKVGRPSRGLAMRITVRFSPDEAAIIRRIAEEQEVPLSEVVRQAVLARDS